MPWHQITHLLLLKLNWAIIGAGAKLFGSITAGENAKVGSNSMVTNALAKPYLIQDKSVYCTASIGFAFYPHDAQSIDTLIKNADKAMYITKTQGRNNIYYYTDNLKQTLSNGL